MTMQTISPRVSEVPQTLIMKLILLLLILIPCVSLTQAQTSVPYSKATLLAGLKQSAVDKKLSSADFVRLIEERGVDFQMTTRDEAQLRLAGATDEVIAAIRNNYRHVPKPLPKGSGSLTINSSISDCKVLVNGQLRGTTDSNGRLTLPPLKADRYRVVLKKENYEEQARVVQVSAGVEATETFNLAPLKGSLTIVPVPATARVSIRGLEYRDGVRNLALDPGSYDVVISNHGYKSLERTVVISPGQPLTLPVVLEVLRIEDMLKESIASFQRRDFIQTIAKGREVLGSFPTNAQAALLVGLGYYHSDRYSESLEFLTKAMMLGEQVILPIKHHHTAFLSADLCSGRITIGRGILSFTSTDRSGHDFSVPANKIYELTSEPRKFGRVHVRVGIPKGTKEDKKTYNFHVSHAYLYRDTATSPAFVRCNNCDEETAVIYQVLRQLKDAPQGSSPQMNLQSEPSSGSADRQAPRLKDRVSGGASIAPPSTVFRSVHIAGKYNFSVPDNWKQADSSIRSVTFAPEGSVATIAAQRQFSHGVQIGTYPSQGSALPVAFEQFINLLLKGNLHLRQTVSNQRAEIRGRLALTAPLRGVPPTSTREEFTVVYATLMRNGDLFYVIAVSPHDEVAVYSPTFGRIIGSIEFLD